MTPRRPLVSTSVRDPTTAAVPSEGPSDQSATEHALLAAIIDSTEDAVVSKTLDGIITSWNRGAERIFGYRADEVIGQHVSLLIPPERINEETEILNAIQRGQKHRIYESERVRKDGKRIPVSLTVSPLRDPTGKVVGASKIARDITERKKAAAVLARVNEELEARVLERTQELERAVRELEAFNSAVSHDLRTPLRAILGFSQLALDSDEVGGRLRENVEYIQRAAKQMHQTVDALLRLARIDRTPVRREPLDVSRIALQVVEELRRQDPGRRVEVEVEPYLRASGDPQLLHVALENLIGNAWKFTRDREVAAITLRRVERRGEAWFALRDNGAGFDSTKAPRLFEPFQRFHGQREFEGMGIGLTTVKRILHNHGGDVEAEATPDAGATFFFRLADVDGPRPPS